MRGHKHFVPIRNTIKDTCQYIPTCSSAYPNTQAPNAGQYRYLPQLASAQVGTDTACSQLLIHDLPPQNVHDLPPQDFGLFCNSRCDRLRSTLPLLAEDDITAQVHRSAWLLLTRRGSRELGFQSDHTCGSWAPQKIVPHRCCVREFGRVVTMGTFSSIYTTPEREQRKHAVQASLSDSPW